MEVARLFHLRTQLDGFARDHEASVSSMMEGARTLHCRVDPRLDDFEDEQTIAGHHPSVDHPAFQVCMAFSDERRTDLRSRHGGEVKGRELVCVRTGCVAAAHNLFSQLHRGYVDDTFTGRIQQAEGILRSLMTQPTSGGANSIIMCHDMVMMFGRSLPAVVSSTTGPGSSKPYTFASTRDFLAINEPNAMMSAQGFRQSWDKTCADTIYFEWQGSVTNPDYS